MRDRFILVVNRRMLLVVPVSSKSYQCLFPVRNLSFWFGWFEWKMPFVWEFSCWFFCKSTFCCWWVSELHGSHLGSLQAGLQCSSQIFFHIYDVYSSMCMYESLIAKLTWRARSFRALKTAQGSPFHSPIRQAGLGPRISWKPSSKGCRIDLNGVMCTTEKSC